MQPRFLLPCLTLIIFTACHSAEPIVERSSSPAKPTTAICGDGICAGGEKKKCPEDCGDSTSPVCGDGICDSEESCASCDSDCGPCVASCGCNNDGVCNEGEDCTTCPSDCSSSGKGKKRQCCGDNTLDTSLCGADAGSPYPDTDGDGSFDCVDLCPTDAAKVDPGERGCGLEDPDRQSVSAGVATSLAVTGATLFIPADALPVGTIVSLITTPLESSTFPSGSFAQEAAQSQVVSVEFSAAVRAKEDLLLRLSLPPTLLTNFYGRSHIAGGLHPAHSTDAWSIRVGSYDSVTQSLDFALAATAATADFIVMGPVDSFAMLAAPSQPSMDLEPSEQAIMTSASMAMNWNTMSWVALCGDDQAQCPTGLLGTAATRMSTAVDRLTALDGAFSHAMMATIKKGELARTGLLYGFHSETGTSFESLPEDTELLLAFLMGDDSLGANAGIYDPVDHSIRIEAKELAASPENGDTFVHELFHAVQEFIMPSIYASWLNESTAVVAEYATINSASSFLLALRPYGLWRNWHEPLNSATAPLSHQSAEYLLSKWSGSAAPLAGFMQALEAKSEAEDTIIETHHYDLIDQVLSGDLVPAYLDLIKRRSGEAYPHPPQLNGCPAGPEMCADHTLLPMTAVKHIVTISGDEPLGCADDERMHITSIDGTVSVATTTGIASDLMMLVGEGDTGSFQIAASATSDSSVVSFWLVNKSYTDEIHYELRGNQLVHFSCVPDPNKDCLYLEDQFPGSNWYKCATTCCQDGQHCNILTDPDWIHDGHNHYGQGSCYNPGEEGVRYGMDPICTTQNAQPVEEVYGFRVKQACGGHDRGNGDEDNHIMLGTATCYVSEACDRGAACMLSEDGVPSCVAW